MKHRPFWPPGSRGRTFHSQGTSPSFPYWPLRQRVWETSTDRQASPGSFSGSRCPWASCLVLLRLDFPTSNWSRTTPLPGRPQGHVCRCWPAGRARRRGHHCSLLMLPWEGRPWKWASERAQTGPTHVQGAEPGANCFLTDCAWPTVGSRGLKEPQEPWPRIAQRTVGAEASTTHPAP